jgi:hypothetical protein
MTPKSFKTTQRSNASDDISSEVLVKTSLFSRTRYSWLTIIMSVIAVGGILGTVGIPVVSFAILRPTTLTLRSEFKKLFDVKEIFDK